MALQVRRPFPGHVKNKYVMQIVWPNLFIFLILHLFGVCGMWQLYANARIHTVIWVLFWCQISGEGVALGAHRLYSHRSFEATLPIRIGLIILQTIAGQNCLYIWVRDHRQHHRYSDSDADPHNARRGFFFSHIGWLMVRKHPDVIAKGKNIDMTDLQADPLVMFQKRYYHLLYLMLSLMMPTILPCVLWEENLWVSLMSCYFTRTIIVLNSTWLVNSAAHVFGTRPYDKNIPPAENALVSIVTFGEGYHNFHHKFPKDYRAGEDGHFLNLRATIIDALHKLNAVHGLKVASKKSIIRCILHKGKTRFPLIYEEHAKEAMCKNKKKKNTLQ